MTTPQQALDNACQSLMHEAALLISQAEALGMVVTITTEPNVPLAMGNSRMVPDVRPGPVYYRKGLL